MERVVDIYCLGRWWSPHRWRCPRITLVDKVGTGHRLDLMIWEVFYNLKGSMIISSHFIPSSSGTILFSSIVICNQEKMQLYF